MQKRSTNDWHWSPAQRIGRFVTAAAAADDDGDHVNNFSKYVSFKRHTFDIVLVVVALDFRQ